MTRLTKPVVALVLPLVWASPLGAQDVSERAAELRRAGDDSAAVALLEPAVSRSPAPRISAELGLAYQGAGRGVEAERHLAEALGTRDPWVEQHRAGLELALRYVETSLGWLLLECSTDGERAHVAGAELACGEPLRIRAGEHLVEVRAPGRRSEQTVATVAAGERARVRLALEAHECSSWRMIHMAGAEGGCCWPGQAFVDGGCTGTPECPMDMSLEGDECVPLEGQAGHLATFRLGLFGGVTKFLQTDTGLFRPGVDASSSAIAFGPRAELRLGIHAFGIFSLEGIVGGARHDVEHWLDCDPADTASCIDSSPSAYTLDFGLMLQAHTDPRREPGVFDLHLGLGVRPWARMHFEDDRGTAKLTASVLALEGGASWFLGSAVSIDVAALAEAWLPWKYCGFAPDASFNCVDGDELERELAWSALAGLTFHVD